MDVTLDRIVQDIFVLIELFVHAIEPFHSNHFISFLTQTPGHLVTGLLAVLQIDPPSEKATSLRMAHSLWMILSQYEKTNHNPYLLLLYNETQSGPIKVRAWYLPPRLLRLIRFDSMPSLCGSYARVDPLQSAAHDLFRIEQQVQPPLLHPVKISLPITPIVYCFSFEQEMARSGQRKGYIRSAATYLKSYVVTTPTFNAK